MTKPRKDWLAIAVSIICALIMMYMLFVVLSGHE